MRDRLVSDCVAERAELVSDSVADRDGVVAVSLRGTGWPLHAVLQRGTGLVSGCVVERDCSIYWGGGGGGGEGAVGKLPPPPPPPPKQTRGNL